MDETTVTTGDDVFEVQPITSRVRQTVAWVRNFGSRTDASALLLFLNENSRDVDIAARFT